MTPLLERLSRSDQCLVGTVVSFCDPSFVEAVASALDYVWVDLEHAANDVHDAQNSVIGARAAGVPSLVRLPRWESERLHAVLDLGPDGVVAPMVNDARAARDFVQRISYPPDGTRGFGHRRASNYGRDSQAFVNSRERPLTIVQIETADAVASAGEIAEVDGIDMLFVGCADLSFSLGVPLQPAHPLVLEAVERVRACAQRAGRFFGVGLGPPVANIRPVTEGGANLVLYSSDTRIVATAMDGTFEEIRGEICRTA